MAGIRRQHSGHGLQVATGAEHMQNPLPLPCQPGIEAPSPGKRAPQQGAIEIGHQHQLGILGQRGPQVLFQLLTRDGRQHRIKP